MFKKGNKLNKLNNSNNSGKINFNLGLVSLLLLLLLLCLVVFAIYRGLHQPKSTYIEPFVTLDTFEDENIEFNLKPLSGEETLFDVTNNEFVDALNNLHQASNNYNEKRLKETLLSAERDKQEYRDLMNKQRELDNEIKKESNKVPNIINSIKSNFNNQILSLESYDPNNYKVQINDKCLTVYDDNKYTLTNCDKSINMSDSQIFTTERIRDAYAAKRFTGVNINKFADYPYNMFKSKVTDQCLTLNNEGVSVQKCNPNYSRQQFKISGDKNLCPKL